MWFKQLSFFIVPAKEMPGVEETERCLRAAAFKPAQGLSRMGEGFAFLTPDGENMLAEAGKSLRFSLRREEKILPAAVVREACEKQAAAISTAEGRTPGRQEIRQIKEQIVDELLPRAFSQSRYTDMLYVRDAGLLLVNAAPARAENALSRLREALGGLYARLPDTVRSPSSLMTDWVLAGVADGDFVLDSDCELRGAGEPVSTVRVARQDVTAEEVVQHVKNGKTVTRLGLTWRDQLSFVLNHDLSLSRLRFSESMQSEAKERGEDDPIAFDLATQLLTAEILSATVTELIALLGGLTQA